MPVKLASLGVLTLIDDGAVGQVFSTGYRLRTNPVALAFKKVKSGLSPDKRNAAIAEMRNAIVFRRSLAAEDQELLDEYTAWPLEMVTHENREVGCLMPLIPKDFFAKVNPPGEKPKLRTRNVKFLSAPEQENLGRGFSRREMDAFSDRLAIFAVIAKLAFAIGLLHKHGRVYGDLSLNNAVFALDPPRVMLIDCDATASLSDLKRRQMNSPFFDAPEFQPVGTHPFARGNPQLQDESSDVYKLALCLIRCLNRGKGATQLRDVTPALAAALGPTATNCWKAALNSNPNARPTSKELYTTLANVVSAQSQAPTIDEFFAVSTVVPRGTDVVLVWTVSGANGAFLVGPEGSRIPVDPSWGTYSIPAYRTGCYTLEVARRGTIISQSTEPVRVFDLPAFDISREEYPMPTIPALDAVEIASVIQALPQRPAVEIGTDFVPVMSSPVLEPISSGSLLNSISDALAVPTWVPTGLEDLHRRCAMDDAPPVTDGSQLAHRVNTLLSSIDTIGVELEQAHRHAKSELSSATSKALNAATQRMSLAIEAKANSLTP